MKIIFDKNGLLKPEKWTKPNFFIRDGQKAGYGDFLSTKSVIRALNKKWRRFFDFFKKVKSAKICTTPLRRTHVGPIFSF